MPRLQMLILRQLEEPVQENSAIADDTVTVSISWFELAGRINTWVLSPSGIVAGHFA